MNIKIMYVQNIVIPLYVILYMIQYKKKMSNKPDVRTAGPLKT